MNPSLIQQLAEIFLSTEIWSFIVEIHRYSILNIYVINSCSQRGFTVCAYAQHQNCGNTNETYCILKMFSDTTMSTVKPIRVKTK